MKVPNCSMQGRFLSALLFSCAALAQDDAVRLAPPGKIECPRDQLTSYTGEVVQLRRGMSQTELRIKTDWGTFEAVRIGHPESGDPSAWFLVAGKPFEASDWKHVESSAGQLRQGVRATAWVCDDGRNPIIDWLTPRE